MTESTQYINKLLDNLFRHESGKLVAVLTRIFGPANIALAEDVVQDAMMEAVTNWTYSGIPDNPTGWLYMVAKNKAINLVNREQFKNNNSSELLHFLQSQWTATPLLDNLFTEKEIQDDQLRMIFTCCHPSISADSQVALTLKTLCGFSIAEIARAFITNTENINKRLVRARETIRVNKISFEIPGGKELELRIDTVAEIIYLLFNEGYSASSGKDLIRYELCEEAIGLAELIIGHPAIQNKSTVLALLALMQLNTSRFRARQDADGNILTLEHQDRSLWNLTLMESGFSNLEKSLAKNQVSVYHLLAAISAYHCAAKNYKSTDWISILSLYDNLIQLDKSPLVLLNRAIALSKVSGADKAIEELDKIKETVPLISYYLFYSTQASLYMELRQFKNAAPLLRKAIELAPLDAEKMLLENKLSDCLKK